MEQDTPETLANDLRFMLARQRRRLRDTEKALDEDQATRDNLVVAYAIMGTTANETNAWLYRAKLALQKGII